MAEKHKISEIASLLGVTTHMLRYYEKRGIIRPEVDPENGYRYYSVIDTRRFNLCRVYRSLGFSLDESKQLLENIEASEVPPLFDQRVSDARKEIFCAQEKIKILEERKRVLIDLDQYVDAIHRIHVPAFYRLAFSQKEVPEKDIIRIRDTWLEYLPLVNWSSCIPKEVQQRGEGDLYYRYGLDVPVEYAEYLGLYHDAPVTLVPEADYISTIFAKDNGPDYTWDNIEVMQRYLEAHPELEAGEAYSNILNSRIINGKHVNYHYYRVRLL